MKKIQQIYKLSVKDSTPIKVGKHKNVCCYSAFY